MSMNLLITELILSINENNLRTWESLKEYNNITNAKVIEKGEPLFMRLEVEEENNTAIIVILVSIVVFTVLLYLLRRYQKKKKGA